MRPAALALLASLACASRSSPPSADGSVGVSTPAPEPASIAARADISPPATSRADEAAPERLYESIEQRAKVREVLARPDVAPWRGVYRGGGPVRLRPDGPAVDRFTDVGDERRFRVFETRDDLARIVFTHAGVTLLAWVRLADFVPQPKEQLVLATAPGELPIDGVGRIEIAPGERVQVVQTRDDWHEVELARRSLRGWLPAAAFAPVFPNSGFPARTGRTSGIALQRTRIHDRPGGKVIWRFSAERDTDVDIVRETKHWLEIVFVAPCDDTFRVTGFVRRKDIRDIQVHGGRGFGCPIVEIGTSRSRDDDAIDVQLPEGTELFDEVGQLVGIVRKNNMLRKTSDGTLHVHSRWGSIPVVAEVEATPLPPR